MSHSDTDPSRTPSDASERTPVARPRPLLTRGDSLLEGYPHIVEPIDAETAARLWRHVPGLRSGATLVGPDLYVYPAVSPASIAVPYHYPVDAGDVWVVSVPCAGATWLQEMVWLVASGCDWQAAQTELWPLRWQWAELKCLSAAVVARDLWWHKVKDNVFNLPRLLWASARNAWYSGPAHPPRFVKSHMPLSMLPPTLLQKGKVIYVARNPKDVLVSYFHHHKMFLSHGWEGTFEEFIDLFLSDKLIQMAFFPHVQEAWMKRHHSNLLFLFYEDLQTNLSRVIRKVADFLRVPITNENVSLLYDHLRFETMKANPYTQLHWLQDQGLISATESLYRIGRTGVWNSYFSHESNSKINAWIERNLHGSDLRFRFQVDPDEEEERERFRKQMTVILSNSSKCAK